MFFHNFKYAFLTLFKNKMLIFWTFAFPLILGTFFNLAFSNIENSEKLIASNIAIVNNEAFNNDSILKETFQTLGDSQNDQQLFNIQYIDQEEAQKLLNDGEIIGYILVEDNSPKVIVTSSGIDETVLKYVMEEILQTKEMVSILAQQQIGNQAPTEIDYQKIYQNVLTMISNANPNIQNISSKNLSYTMVEFYTLIAMVCLYGGILGTAAINQTLANMSSNGKRVSIAPISKGKLILSSTLASYLVQLIGLFLLFLYTIVILKIDYGNNLPLIVLLSLAGSLAGLSVGVAVGCLLKANEDIKTGIIVSFTMLGCFLSGMMGITMKYVIDTHVPFLNKINPAAMITDGFYSLYYYDTFGRYFTNVISLVIFAAVMLFISYLSLRRQDYDSI